MVNLRASLSLFLVCVVACCHCESLTPLIAWSNSDVLSSVKQSQVSSVIEVVEQLHLEGLVVVFRTDKLTFDDIAKYGGVYGDENNALGSLQGFVGGAESSLWSGIHGNSGSTLVDTLAWKMGVEPLYLKGLKDLSGFTSSPRLVVVDLPEASGEETFAQQDALISEVMEVVRGLTTSFTAFYTGESDQRTTEVPITSRERRSLQPRQTASDDSNSTFTYSRNATKDGHCLLFYLSNRTLEYHGTSSRCSLTLINDNSAIDGSCEHQNRYNISYFEADFNKTCNETEAGETWRLRFEFPNELSNFTRDVSSDFSSNFSVPYGYWSMIIILDKMDEVSVNKTLNQTLFRRPYYPLAVPFGLSYSCSSPTYNNFSNGNESILLHGIQVQAYNVTYVDGQGNPVFSTYYDCEGYFTDASWMGIFSVLIFMVVFYIAMVFAFSIQTVDRFDDPRGPTISVENLH